MKLINIVYLILFISFCVFGRKKVKSSKQTSNINNAHNSNLLISEWINHRETPKKELGTLYQNDSINMQKTWGQHLIFEEDGVFTDVYFMPCRVGESDPHKYIGNWKLNGDKIIISNLKEIYNSAHYNSKYKDNSDMKLNEIGEFRIIDIKENELHIEIIKDYEIKIEEKVIKR